MTIFLLALIVCLLLTCAVLLRHRARARAEISKLVASAESSARARRSLAESLAAIVNDKERVAPGQARRVRLYCAGLARLLGCTAGEVAALDAASLIHDVGKIAVPDAVLTKPGKLTSDEFERMKAHTAVGAELLARAGFDALTVSTVRHHHERWDGGGYPDGLRGEGIPLTARILAVADSFASLREDRPYRKGLDRQESVDFLMRNSGRLFDPTLVSLFISNLTLLEKEVRSSRPALPSDGPQAPPQMLAGRQVSTPDARPSRGTMDEVAYAGGTNIVLEDDELNGLYDLSARLRESPSREKMCGVFSAMLERLVPFETCAITLPHPVTSEKTVSFVYGLHGHFISGRKVELGQGVTGWVLANQQPFCNAAPQSDFPPHLAERFADYKTSAVYPVTFHGNRLGAVSLYASSVDKYSERQQHIISEAVAIFTPEISGLLERTGNPANVPRDPGRKRPAALSGEGDEDSPDDTAAPVN